MRIPIVLATAAGIGLALVAFGAIGAMTRGSSQPNTDRVPVLVELFTSEGCSSCPPADELLIALDQEQFVPGALVIPLSEHVEYWNDPWNDPYSAPAFTERQRAYHPILGSTALYTPEMIVDGRMQFVGSQRMLAEHAITRAVSINKATITLGVDGEPTDGSVEVEVSVSNLAALGRTEDLELWIAVTEVGLETLVPRGENAFRQLRHAAVVRSLEHVETLRPPAWDETPHRVHVPIAQGWHAANLRVVAFLQETQTRHIRGAGQVALD